MILTIRTDKPEAEIGLLDNGKQIDVEVWTAHRELSNTLLVKIEELLKRNSKSIIDLSGIAVFKGPGSFTGLRIGATVGNTIAYSQSIPIVSNAGDEWIDESVNRLASGEDETIALPDYGGEAKITRPKK